MKARIAKRFTFDAAHRLDTLPLEHKCNRLHGHTYSVEIIVFGDVVNGFVIDYAELESIWMAQIHCRLDHRYLNEVPGLEVPSTEVLAHWIWKELVTLAQLRDILDGVRVKESSSTWCSVGRLPIFGDDHYENLR